jgi:DNA-binding PadR family transcriptional regulator
MRPIRVYQLQREFSMEMGADCVLDVLSDFRGPTPTEALVTECHKDKISAPATTYKKLSLLKAKGLVRECNHPSDRDQRKTWIEITEKGLEYLTAWEGDMYEVPQLSNAKTEVEETRVIEENPRWTKRRRVCKNCGFTLWTVEMPAEDVVVKEGNT